MKNVSKLLSVLLCLAMVIGIFTMAVGAAAGDHVVINEVYGGGGNSGSVYKYDFVELYNPTSSSVSLEGKSLQYASKTGTFGNNIFTFPDGASIAANGYYLVRMAAGNNDTGELPTHDAEGTFAMSGTEFKIALVANTEAITGKADTDVIDFLGVGGANEYEGNGTAAKISNSTSASRNTNGVDTNDNSADFSNVTPSPKGSANNPGATTINVTGVTLDKTTATVEVGASVSLAATVAPSNATNKTVTWTSSDNTVATVSGGKVTGVKAGTATITATTADGNKTATCAVTVTARPTIADGEYIIWNPGSNKALSSNLSREGSYYLGGVDVTLTGSTLTGYGDTEVWVVTNNSDGTITIATPDGKKLSLGASFSSTPFDDVNDKWALNTAAEGQYYIVNVGRAGQTLQWRAGSDYNYFSCYTSPNVENYGFTFTKHNVAVTGVTLDKTSQNLTVGGSVDLVATVAPSNATNQDVTWTSSNTAVATVANGKVTAVAAGTATITVTTADGSKTATCTITVVAATVPATGVTLDKTTASLEVGKDVTLTATVAPADSTDAVVWSTSDATIATVAGGKVTALKAGTVTITAKAGDKTATCTVTVTAPVVEEEDDNTGSTTPSKPAVSTWTVQSTPKTGVSFKFGLNQKGLSKQLWFTGVMDGYYLAMSEDVKDAVDVVVETVEGGYRLAFTKEGVKKYIDIVPRDGDAKKASVVITDEPTAVLTWDNTAKTFFAKLGEETFWLGTYGTYKTISVSNTSYISGDNASKIDVSQYIAHLYLDTASSTGDAFEPMVIVLALAAVSALAVLALNKKKFSF